MWCCGSLVSRVYHVCCTDSKIWPAANECLALSAPKVWWVRTSGNDSADCGLDAKPCRTVQYTVALASAGDSIKLGSPAFPCERAPLGVLITKPLFVSSAVGMTEFNCQNKGRAFSVTDTSISFAGMQ